VAHRRRLHRFPTTSQRGSGGFSILAEKCEPLLLGALARKGRSRELVAKLVAGRDKVF
jgi:hypothetical protein